MAKFGGFTPEGVEYEGFIDKTYAGPGMVGKGAPAVPSRRMASPFVATQAYRGAWMQIDFVSQGYPGAMLLLGYGENILRLHAAELPKRIKQKVIEEFESGGERWYPYTPAYSAWKGVPLFPTDLVLSGKLKQAVYDFEPEVSAVPTGDGLGIGGFET